MAIPYPDINPVAIKLGPLKFRWYGLMYMVGFAAAWLLGRYRAGRKHFDWTGREVDDFIFMAVAGLILGARIGYVLFYNPGVYLDDPLQVLMVWKGGMSFHGGLLGVCAACWFFGRKTGRAFFQVTDFIVPLTPIGILAGRLGNFINGELYGRITSAPWAMVFPDGGPYARHPSQLYEAFLEGVVLFAAVWIYSSKPRPYRSVSGLFILLYGSFRFFVEFFRQPDLQLGFVAFDWMTMGQLLSLPMILGGIALIAWSRYSPEPPRRNRDLASARDD
jgi:phosphatidylglycerol:prolipoprotein diacylglycerol transferase